MSGLVPRVAAIVGGSALVGAVAGVAWWALAPRDTLEVFNGVAYPEGFQPEAYAGSDALAALLCAVCGLLVATVALVLTRRRHTLSTLQVLLATVVGGALGSVVMWFVGTRLGAVDVAAAIAAVGEGGLFTAPLVLRMPGVLVLWPAACALAVFGVAVSDWWQTRPVR